MDECEMSMNTWSGLLGIAMALLMSGATLAADTTTFESCVDGMGKTLPAAEDTQQNLLVRTVAENGQTTIRYNPGVLPRLTFTARLFLYSHECARHGLGGSGKMISLARARLADCMAANTLVGSEAIKREDLPALEAELAFSEAEWQLLPGPMRNIDITHCRPTGGGVLRLPVDTPPTDKQVGWNNCVRACADKLWTCQKRGGGDSACLETHSQCKAGCGPADKPAADKPAD
jgi:hypothetical protein